LSQAARNFAVKIRGDILKKKAEQAGVSIEQLAEAVARTGLDGDRAISAIGNWMAGRDHPRCKAQDIAKLAEAVGAAPKDIARFTSEVRHHRGSPRKAKLLMDLIKGKNVIDAENLLRFSTKRAAVNVRKALVAARTDAELAEADIGRLFVVESRVDKGPVMKRFQPKDRGRAHKIIKPLSHITVGLEEKA
jgi:large subunit ribosomal protein L22